LPPPFFSVEGTDVPGRCVGAGVQFEHHPAGRATEEARTAPGCTGFSRGRSDGDEWLMPKNSTRWRLSIQRSRTPARPDDQARCAANTDSIVGGAFGRAYILST